MRVRLTLITEIIAPYRVPVFNALAARADVDLHVLFLAENDPKLRHWTVPKSEIQFSYQVLPSLRLRLGNLNLLLNRSIPSALRQAQPAAIICGGYNYPASWQAAFWARKHNIPFLLWTESNAADHRARNAVLESAKRKFLTLCRGFVVPGTASRSYLQQLGVSESLIFTAPDAVDNTLFINGARRARENYVAVRRQRVIPERYFLYVGRCVSEKGVFDLLEAYAKLDPEIRAIVGLVFVGDGAARAELERRGQLIKPGTVTFSGFVQKKELAEFYALADALVFPTHSDPWGLVVNEAMACGLPVIATNVAGSVPDLVHNGANGLIVPVADTAALISAMTTLAKNDELRVQMGQCSAEKIGANSPEASAAGMAEAALAVTGASP
jgi:glycosyltransferase involved in cell wall biosynthesis